MKIRDIFSREIQRDIKEVIKVDDSTSILEEIEEYVATDHIADELEAALEVYKDTILSPSEDINMWVSGFFGSGKSSFAKIFGYLLANPVVGGDSLTDRFFAHNNIPAAKSLLEGIHAQAPTACVFLDLNTSPNVLQEGEPIVLPIYRTLLSEFEYSRDVTLAELEFYLEGRGLLEDFVARFDELYGSWEDQRDINLAKNPASRVMHDLDPETYPNADSFSNSAEPPAISAKWFKKRALDMLARRRTGKKRLVLIVDEVGQYVSRSTDRMRHLQGLAEECQKSDGQLWLVATSQEKLTDVIDSLEGKQTELAKAQDRFEIKVDLLPSDIDEVTGKRVLDKTAEGASYVKALLDADRNKLSTAVALQSDRHQPFADEDFVRLYPLVPYQLQVLIDAVSARRNQGGMPQTMGGSNRTLIRHAQQLLSNASVGMAEDEVGTLVTLDRSYELLEDVIPTAWRYEVDQVADRHGDDSYEARIMRVVALCTDVPGVPLSSRNLAAALHPSMDADPVGSQVSDALGRLVSEDRLRETDDGYRLQSPEQKDWEKTRRNIDMKPGDAVRHRKRILKDALGSLTVSSGRTFKVELYAEREKMSDGDIRLDIREDADLDGIRRTSRSEDAENRIFWVYAVANDTYDALRELHRSTEMIERYDNASQSDIERGLLAEERRRRDRALKQAEQLLSRDITAGTVVFEGSTDEPPKGELRASTQGVVSEHLDKIYPSLDLFAGNFNRNDVLKVLQADSLDGLPESCGPDGLGVFRTMATGRELVVDSGPIEVVVAYINARKQYGEEQNGAQLERHFGGPPYGAPVESIQVVLAAAVRAGLIEVVSQAARITSSTDRRLEAVFQTIPRFRAASFRPADGEGVPLEVRAEVSEWLHALTGDQVSVDEAHLAAVGRSLFGGLQAPATRIRSTLQGARLVVPDLVLTVDELVGRLGGSDDVIVIETMHERRADLEVGQATLSSYETLVENDLDSLHAALIAADAAGSLAAADAPKWGRELTELLARARYVEDLARIRSLTTKIETAGASEADEARSALEQAVAEAVDHLRTRYASVEDVEFDVATQPLMGLATAATLAVLRANRQALPGVVSEVEARLDALSSSRTVKPMRVADIWAAPITSVQELDQALERIREAVAAQLDDETAVRLR